MLTRGHVAGGKNFKVHIDGYNLLPYPTGQEAHSPRPGFVYFSADGDVLALRSDNWKVAAPFAGREALTPRSSIVYYKSGIKAYGTVRAFPAGLRFVLGSPAATPARFAATEGSEMWSCGASFHNVDFPVSCPAHADLIIRFDAPSCWDGVNLDTPDHKRHMAYPVNGACPADHPVAPPMLEYRIAYPVTGKDTSLLRLLSGPSYSWHADFFAAWSMPTEEALVMQCINGGGQCDTRGYDAHHPERGYVLDATGHLIK